LGKPSSPNDAFSKLVIVDFVQQKFEILSRRSCFSKLVEEGLQKDATEKNYSEQTLLGVCALQNVNKDDSILGE